MARNLLTDTALRTLKRDGVRRRLSDGEGLYLLTNVKGGSHAWRFDYSIDGKRKTLSLGTFPPVTLAAARRKAEEYRALVERGHQPERRAQGEEGRAGAPA